MKIDYEVIHSHSSRSYSNQKAVMMNDGKTIYSAFADGEAYFRSRKYITVNGEKFYSDISKTISYPASSMSIYDGRWRGRKEQMYYKGCTAVFYRGEFYGLYDFKHSTIDDLERTLLCLDELWNDLEWCVSDSNLNGYTRLISGHSRWVSRKITKEEILMTHKELIEKSNKSPYNCENAVRIFIRDICNYLMITESQYISGKYDVKNQMIKRLHKKINNSK